MDKGYVRTQKFGDKMGGRQRKDIHKKAQPYGQIAKGERQKSKRHIFGARCFEMYKREHNAAKQIDVIDNGYHKHRLRFFT